MFNVSHLCDKLLHKGMCTKTKQNKTQTNKKTNKQTNKQAHKREFEFAAAASTILTDHYSLQAQGVFCDSNFRTVAENPAFQQHRRRKPPLQVAPSQKTPLTVQLLKKPPKTVAKKTRPIHLSSSDPRTTWDATLARYVPPSNVRDADAPSL